MEIFSDYIIGIFIQITVWLITDLIKRKRGGNS